MAAQTAFILYSRRHDFFFLDDFLGFIVAQNAGLNRSYLLHDVFGQFAPGYRLLDYLFIKFLGLHYAGVRLFDIATISATTLTILAIARAWAARLPLLLAALAFIPFSPIFSGTLQWFSAALHVLDGMAIGAATLACFATPRQIGWPRRCAGAALFALSLTFYAKMLFLPLLIVGIRIFAASQSGKKLNASMQPAVLDILPLAPVCFLYLIVVIIGHYGSGQPPTGLLPVLAFIRIGFTDGLACNLFGLDTALPWRRTLACALLITPVLLAAIRNPRTLSVWTGFLVQFIVAMAAIAWGRVTMFGADSAALSRYHAETSVFYMICVIITLSARDTSRPRVFTPALVSLLRTGGIFAAVAVLMIALCRQSLRAPLIYPRDDGAIAAYVTNFRNGLSRTACQKIFDGIVPDWILPAWTAPLNHVHNLATLFNAPPCFTDEKSSAVSFDSLGQLEIQKDK